MNDILKPYEEIRPKGVTLRGSPITVIVNTTEPFVNTIDEGFLWSKLTKKERNKIREIVILQKLDKEGF